MSTIQWILIAIVCGAIEIFTAGFWFLWLSLAGLLVAIGVVLGILPNLEIQLIVYSLVTLLFIIFTRPLILKFFKSNDTASNVHALIGQHGMALSHIAPLQYGQVKVNGEIWTAIAETEIESEQRIVVTGIDGVKLRVDHA
ncbi:MAG: NfeD family protein [Syntrophomonadaceae bacterium]|nr:NfeD family protein [Syntrophomonadaceae bacterium]MDD3022397.1 NfeD family protein [Syntrophomonadaceae bacterium]